MQPIIFTRAEAEYILSAIDQRIQKSGDGVVPAHVGVAIVEKLQEALKPPPHVGDEAT